MRFEALALFLKRIGMLDTSWDDLDLLASTAQGESPALAGLRVSVNPALQFGEETAAVLPYLRQVFGVHDGGIRIINAAWEATPAQTSLVTGEGEACGAALLYAWLMQLHPRTRVRMHPSGLDPEQRALERCNVFVVGGPMYNSHTAELLRRVKARFAFVDSKLLDAETGIQYGFERAQQDGTASGMTDYGFMLACRSPYASHRRALVFAGCTTFGTLAPLGALASQRIAKGLLAWMARRNGSEDGFQIPVKAEWPAEQDEDPWPSHVTVLADPSQVELLPSAGEAAAPPQSR